MVHDIDAVEKYTLLRPNYVAFTERIRSLIEELLQVNNIKAHLIEGRAKTVDSFREKIRRPGKHYTEPLDELSDLSGIRVIVNYLEDVEKVAKIISTEFEIVKFENSHLASEYSPDKFGYISHHSIVTLTKNRGKLPEWRIYKKLRSEIQIRTVLQHSWAVVSHALQYKHESDVPKPLRRKLYRLAGLFELADEEFTSIRTQTELLRNEANKSLDVGDNQIPLNPISLNAFLHKWPKFNEIRAYMESIKYNFNEFTIEDESDKIDYFGVISYQCESFGIDTIHDFESIINYDAKPFLGKAKSDHETPWYVSNQFVLYLLFIRANINKFTVEDLLKIGWDESIATRVINSAKEDKRSTKRS